MKKLVLSMSFYGLLLTSPALSAFDGFYVGASTGVNAIQGKQTGFINARNGIADVDSYSDTLNTDLIDAKWMGSVYAGYGCHWNCFYGGIEAFAQYTINKFNFSSNSFHAFSGFGFGLEDSTRIDIGPWHYGIDFRPGFLVGSSTLLYGRIGFERASIKVQSTAFNGNAGFLLSELQISERKKKENTYLRLGAGIEHYISSCLSLRADYTYTDLRRISINQEEFSPASLIFVEESKNLNLNNHALTVGLSYHFSNLRNYGCCACNGANFCGFYLGGSLGAALAHASQTGEFINVSPGSGVANSAIRTFNANSHFVQTSFRGLAYAGYGMNWNLLYGGLEIFAQYSPFSRHIDENHPFIVNVAPAVTVVNSESTRAKIDPWQFGVQVRPGFMINPCTLVYGTIGTSCARISYRRELTSTPVTNAFSLSTSDHSRKATLRAGGGLEYAFSRCLSVRADYVYTNYGKLHLDGFASVKDPALGDLSLSNDTTIRLCDHAITLGLSWYL